MRINELIKQLKAYAEEYNKETFHREIEGTAKLLTDAADALERTRWIPVEERLSEMKQRVLVTERAGSELQVNVASYWADSGYCAFFDDYGTELDATAWMPLPEPYRKEEP